MPDWEDGEGTVGVGEGEGQIADLGDHIGVGEHHAFGFAGGARGINEGEEVFGVDVGDSLFGGAVAGVAQLAAAFEEVLEMMDVAG